jgi:hypothetical protein
MINRLKIFFSHYGFRDKFRENLNIGVSRNNFAASLHVTLTVTQNVLSISCINVGRGYGQMNYTV